MDHWILYTIRKIYLQGQRIPASEIWVIIAIGNGLVLIQHQAIQQDALKRLQDVIHVTTAAVYHG